MFLPAFVGDLFVSLLMNTVQPQHFCNLGRDQK